jgi:hypothetical protein
VIAGIRASGAKVYYRIGRSFGANVNPLADFDKFANVVKHYSGLALLNSFTRCMKKWLGP